MKILYIHNDYARPSGEEHASSELVSLLREHGHEVRWFKRSSSEISKSSFGRFKAFFTGIYNPFPAKELDKVIKEYNPDLVQVQNLYPLLSSVILHPLRKRGIPVVMRCPNYRVFCPNGLCLDKNGHICEKCFHGVHELWCIRKNCENNIFKSIGYALRNMATRLRGDLLKYVHVFIVQSEFQKEKFIKEGIPKERIGILPGIVPEIQEKRSTEIGTWVSFVGRVSAEKGIYEFIDAARRLPEIPFRVAGNLDSSFVVPSDLPSNIEFVGFVGGENLNEFYRKSRIIVVPSKWYEGFPNVIVRGMLLNRPVITTNIGAMQSIIDHGENGLLVEPGNSVDLQQAISSLWSDKVKCDKLGAAGRLKAQTLYSRENIYKVLMTIYEQAQLINKRD